MTDLPNHVLQVTTVDDSVYAKWLKTNRTRLAQIAFDWSFWRRPDQAEPAGDWRCWLLLAGRGFGKTRTGAEWVRARAEADGVIASLSTIGAALRPLSPVHLGATELSDGTIDLQWTRRSREGWRWLDGIEVPIAEEAELYRIEIVALPSAQRIDVTLAQPHLLLSAAQLGDMRAAGATSLTISVRQIGRFAPSDPATKAFPI